MRFLIAGLGSIGRRHLRNLVTLGEKDLVLYRTRMATLPEDDLKAYPQVSDLPSALEKYHPDAVIVANPTAYHMDVAIPAAEAGCHILLEKPVSHSMEGVDKLITTLENTKSNLLVAFQFRYHPGLTCARGLIADGVIGRPTSSHVQFGEYLPDWHPWEDYRNGYAARADMGGGVVLTQCHSLDYLPWVLGDKVSKVWGFTSKASDLEIDVEDTAKIGLRFEGGALGSLHLDFHRQPPVHTLDIVGTKGSIKWDLIDGATHCYRSKEKKWETYPLPGDWERNVMYLEQMKHFISVMHGNEKPSCTLEDGIQNLKLVQAIHESDRTGRVVDL